MLYYIGSYNLEETTMNLEEAKKKLEQMEHDKLVNEFIFKMLREEEENNGNETE